MNSDLLLREAASEGDVGGIRAALADGAKNYVNALQAAIQSGNRVAELYIKQRAKSDNVSFFTSYIQNMTGNTDRSVGFVLKEGLSEHRGILRSIADNSRRLDFDYMVEDDFTWYDSPLPDHRYHVALETTDRDGENPAGSYGTPGIMFVVYDPFTLIAQSDRDFMLYEVLPLLTLHPSGTAFLNLEVHRSKIFFLTSRSS